MAITSLQATASPIKNKKPEHVDFVVVRENSEGLYKGMGEFKDKGTPNEVATAQAGGQVDVTWGLPDWGGHAVGSFAIKYREQGAATWHNWGSVPDAGNVPQERLNGRPRVDPGAGSRFGPDHRLPG